MKKIQFRSGSKRGLSQFRSGSKRGLRQWRSMEGGGKRDCFVPFQSFYGCWELRYILKQNISINNEGPHLGEQLSSRQDTERHLPPLLLVQPAKGHGISAIVRRTFLNRANSASATKIITLVVYPWKKQASASTGRNSHSWAQLT